MRLLEVLLGGLAAGASVDALTLLALSGGTPTGLVMSLRGADFLVRTGRAGAKVVVDVGVIHGCDEVRRDWVVNLYSTAVG